MIYEVENLPNKLSIELLDRAILFASDFLELDVDLLILFESLKNHQCGFCVYDQDEVVITIAKRLSKQEVIKTLFHEMVHVKQYAEGRLGHVGVWLGQKYDCDYVDLPWEIEAHEMEQKMMELFMRVIKL
jgi:hypothetical protein